MNYRFTAILILMLSMLAFFAEPAYPRNEYLNEYGARCGDFETRIEKEDRENQTIADARDSAMSVIQEEAESRIWLGDDDPEHERNTLLNDVVAIAFQYFN